MKDFNKYIDHLRYKRELLTHAQVCTIAYWELADFQRGVDEPYRDALKGYER